MDSTISNYMPDEESSEEEQEKFFTSDREANETADSGNGCLAILSLLIIAAILFRLVSYDIK